MEARYQLHTSHALLSGQESWYPLGRRLGGPQGRSEHCAEVTNVALPGIEPQSLSL
jgi:hypothetical protein